MKTEILLLMCACRIAAASDFIDLKGRVATFTNLQGEAFSDVSLVRGDLDGIIWRKGASGGRVCYTNIDCAIITDWGIPSNRVSIAKERADRKALADAAYRAQRNAAAHADEVARVERISKSEADQAKSAAMQERDAALNQIAVLEIQIAEAKAKMRRAKAIAHDYNAANTYNDYAPTVYIKATEQLKIDEAEQRLEGMKNEFRLKYPNGESAHRSTNPTK
jgi:hypothetical protein